MAYTQDLQSSLRNWYKNSHRDLPWRVDSDPYRIWLSEIILQQTRVEQGTPYYERFVTTFPTVKDLAAASEDEVLKLWQGLGYYSRGRNLLKAAQMVANQWNGDFPSTYNALIKLPGVGPYTASAIGSIAFDLPTPAVDGNVIRVISRLKAIRVPVDDTAVRKEIEQIAKDLLPSEDPGNHNQAMMELGALICTPKNADCEGCPISDYCQSSYSEWRDQIPLKQKKVRRTRRYFHFVVCTTPNNETLVERRGEKDIWQGLYQFPLLETENPHMLSAHEIEAFLNLDEVMIRTINPMKKHVLSHQDIFAQFYHVELKTVFPENYEVIPTSKLSDLALPRLIDRYLESYDLMHGIPHGID